MSKRHVVCTVIEGKTLEELKSQVMDFTDMDCSFMESFEDARTFTHFQTEESGIEYMSLLDSQGTVIWKDTVVLCISDVVDCICKGV
jgi:hypothetical protein